MTPRIALLLGVHAHQPVGNFDSVIEPKLRAKHPWLLSNRALLVEQIPYGVGQDRGNFQKRIRRRFNCKSIERVSIDRK